MQSSEAECWNIARDFDHTLIGHSSSLSSSQLCMAPVLLGESETVTAVVWLWQAASGLKCLHTSSQDKCFLGGIDCLSLGFA